LQNSSSNTPNKMGTAKMFPLIMSMSLPAMFSMLIQALYNVVDSYFVSLVSENALTAVSLAFPIQMLIIAVGAGTSIGLNSLISRRLGEGDYKSAGDAAAHGLVLAFISWIVFALAGFFLSRPVISAFGADDTVTEMAVSYLSIVLTCSVGVFVEINLEKTLQATGDMVFPMFFQLTGAIGNIILDPIFIFGLFGLPALGVAGAAVATVVAQIISMVFAMIVVFKRKNQISINLKGFRFNGKIIKDIYSVGIPSIIMQSISSLLNMALNGILITFSQTAVAVLGVYYKLQSFVFMPVFGLTHGLMPIMGYNFGAKNKHRLMSCLKIGLSIAVVIMSVGMAIFWAIPKELLSIFNSSGSQELFNIGIPALRTISLCFIPAALGITFSTVFSALGYGSRSLVVSLIRQLVAILPMAYFFAKISLNAVWYAFPLAEIVAFAVSILLFADLYKKTVSNLP